MRLARFAARGRAGDLVTEGLTAAGILAILPLPLFAALAIFR